MPADGGRYGHNSAHSFVKCEAVKVAYRQTKDGMVISFSIHPNDLPPELALAAVGTRVLLAVAEIADDETTPAASDVQSAPARSTEARSEQAKALYRDKSEWQKAATRAAMLCKDEPFQEWVMSQAGRPILSEPYNREMFCRNWMVDRMGVPSRSLISTDEDAYSAFVSLETAYLQATGRFARG